MTARRRATAWRDPSRIRCWSSLHAQNVAQFCLRVTRDRQNGVAQLVEQRHQFCFRRPGATKMLVADLNDERRMELLDERPPTPQDSCLQPLGIKVNEHLVVVKELGHEKAVKRQ